MAKVKTQQKKAKKTPTKYSKLLVVAQKELAVKKKALVSAERTLAKAKQKHEELIAEVARLDMVERSLKAMVEGTEPPTNVRYVYNYPQWVWYPSQQYTVYYNTPYAPNNGYNPPYVPNNGDWTFTNTPSLPTTPTITGTAGLYGTVIGTTLTASGALAAGSSSFCNNVAVSPQDSTGVQSGAHATFTGFVVDLSTGAEPTDAPAEPVTAKMDVPEGE